jgi:hypothetical protein
METIEQRGTSAGIQEDVVRDVLAAAKQRYYAGIFLPTPGHLA